MGVKWHLIVVLTCFYVNVYTKCKRQFRDYINQCLVQIRLGCVYVCERMCTFIPLLVAKLCEMVSKNM